MRQTADGSRALGFPEQRRDPRGAAPEVGTEVAAAKNRGAPPGAASANYAALAGEPMTNEGGVAGLASPLHAGSHQPNTLSEG